MNDDSSQQIKMNQLKPDMFFDMSFMMGEMK